MLVRRLAAAPLLLLAGAEARAFDVPDCAALAAWGEGLSREGAYAYNEATALADAFGPAAAAAFGAAFEAWTRADVSALDKALNACRNTASRAKDAALAETFAAHRQALRAATAMVRDAERARDGVADAWRRLGAADASPDLASALAALAETPLAALDRGFTRIDGARRLAAAMPALPQAEIEAIRAEAAARAAALGETLVTARVAEVEAAPETAAGVIAVRMAAFEARATLGADAAPVEAAAQAREAAIVAALGPDAVALPDCAALGDWATGVDLGATRQTPLGPVVSAVEAPAFAALYGKPLVAWSDADLTAVPALADACREAARAGWFEEDGDTLEAGARAAGRVASRLGEQRARLAALSETEAAYAALLVRVDGAPEGADGFAALASLRSEGQALRLDQTQRAALEAALGARLQALTEAAIAAPLAAFAEAPGTLAGMDAVADALSGTLTGPLAPHLDREAANRLRTEALAARARLAAQAAPEFAAAVQALPDDESGLAALRGFVDRYVDAQDGAFAPMTAASNAKRDGVVGRLLEAGLPRFEAELDAAPRDANGLIMLVATKLAFEDRARRETPAWGVYAERAADRATALRAALVESRCATVRDALDLSAGEAATPVFAGGAAMPLDRFLCEAALWAGSTPAHDGPGLFGGGHTVEVVGPQGYLIRLRLDEAETAPGQAALIGRRYEDPSGGRDLTMEEWSKLGGEMARTWRQDYCVNRREWTDPKAILALDSGSPAALDVADCLIAYPEIPLPVFR